MADLKRALRAPGIIQGKERTGAIISVLFIRKKKRVFPEASCKLLPKVSLARICHMDVPAVREGGDMNFSTSFGGRTKEPTACHKTH